MSTPLKLACLPDPPKSPQEKPDRLFVPTMWVTKSAGDHFIPELTPISDQGTIGSCVANASADALEILLGLEDPNAVTQLSRLYLYWIARASHGATTMDHGTFIRAAMGQMGKVGICAETVWPYEVSRVFTPPPLEATIRASENKITGYYRISSTGRQRVYDLASAIRANRPVVYGTGVERPFQELRAHTMPVTPPSNTARIAGYHAMVLTGLESVAGRLRFISRNSWSTAWGNEGRCWIDEDYLSWSQTSDIWVVTRLDPIP